MKKIVNIIFSLATVFSLFSYSLQVFACDNPEIPHAINQFEILDQYLLTEGVMYNFNEPSGLLSKSCSHTYGPQQYYATQYYHGNLGDCLVRRTIWLKACKNCGYVKYDYSDHQMSHSWVKQKNGLKKCEYCGMTIGQLKEPVESK